ncbi:amidohydrolase [Mailhella sp.]
MRRFGKLSAGLFAAMFMMNGASAWAGELADTAYYGGKIYTMQEAKVDEATNKLIPITKDTQPVMAEVVAAKDGKIVFVGTKADAEAKGYLNKDKVDTIVDLKGKTMYPGFIDGHGHFPDAGTESLYEVDLNTSLILGEGNGADSIDAIIAKLKARAESLPEGTLILGFGYDDTMIAEMRHPNRLDLDKASTKHPIIIGHISGHVKAANSYALEKCGVDGTSTVEGVEMFGAKHGVDASYHGTPTGVLFETAAMSAVPDTKFPAPSADAQAELARAAQIYAAAGCTIADNGAAGGMDIVNTFQQGVANGGLPIRVLWHPMGCYDMEVQPGFTMDVYGYAARAQLGWSEDALAQPANGMFLYANGATAKAQLGDDITYYDVPKVDAVAQKLTGEQWGLPEGLEEGKYDDRIMFGAWKILFDGSPQAYTAWMKYPGYYKWGEHTAEHDKLGAKSSKGEKYLSSIGPLNVQPDRLKFWINLYHKYGQSTEIHTNGSAAAEHWVAALEEAVLNNPEVKDTRHTSIHGQTMERQLFERLSGNYDTINTSMYYDLVGAGADPKNAPAGLAEGMKAQNFFVSFFDNHVYFYGDRHRDIFFGPGRAMNISPTGWADYYGIGYSFHNDTTITPISPLRSITSAVTRLTADGKLLCADGVTDIDATVKYYERDPQEKPGYKKSTFYAYDHRITALQALHAVTYNPAWQNNIDDRVGSIAVGKYADFTVMDVDIVDQAAVDATQIANMRVAATIVGDKVVYGVLPDEKGDFTFGADLGTPLNTDRVDEKGKTVLATAKLTKAEDYAPEDVTLDEGEKLLGAKDMAAELTEAGDSVVFKFNVLGNGSKAGALKLYKVLTDGSKKPYAYTDAAVQNGDTGKWWIADFNTLMTLGENDVLEPNKTYVVNFVIKDNDEEGFDSYKNDNLVVDPVALTTTGEMPDNGEAATKAGPVVGTDTGSAGSGTDSGTDSDSGSGGGSSGGCTVGTNPAYELLALLLASLGVMAGRIFRRRNA